jgi:ribosomal protein L40E
MELDRYKEISRWFNETFPEGPFLKQKILDKFTEIYQKLPKDYYLDYKDNPNFVLINEIMDESTGETKIETMVNPFFLMFVTLSCKATYDAVIKDLNKDNKICSKCKKENPKEAKYCTDCGKQF